MIAKDGLPAKKSLLKSANQNAGYFHIILNSNSITIEGDCKVSLRSSSQQAPGIYVKFDRLQP